MNTLEWFRGSERSEGRSSSPKAECKPQAERFRGRSPLYLLMIWSIVSVFIIAAVAGGMAARKKRRFRPYLRGNIDETQQLGSTLAANTGIRKAVTDVLDQRAWLSSVVLTWTMTNFTSGDGQGPIMVGVAHQDYTLAEIEEWIETQASWSRGDKIAQEINGRKIKTVGTIIQTNNGQLNDGKPVRTKCGWQLEVGQTVALWWYNTGSNALSTTDPDCETLGHANLWPN